MKFSSAAISAMLLSELASCFAAYSMAKPMYVIDESFDQWKVPQSAHDYALHFDSEWQKDVASMVSKDYNHPCVIMYCVGNEITDTGLPFGGAICKGICACFKALDDTRPTMIAINSMLSVLANMKAKLSSRKRMTRRRYSRTSLPSWKA